VPRDNSRVNQNVDLKGGQCIMFDAEGEADLAALEAEYLARDEIERLAWDEHEEIQDAMRKANSLAFNAKQRASEASQRVTESEAAASALAFHKGVVVDKIRAKPATSVADLRVKARIFLRCTQTETLDNLAMDQLGTTQDALLAVSIIRDLLSIADPLA
jgi:hypothetical protein